MKKILLWLSAMMLLGFTALMAETDCDKIKITKSDIVVECDAVTSITETLKESYIDSSRKYVKLIEWGDSPALMAETGGFLGKSMFMANLNRSNTIVVASIGGSGGAPMFQTRVSISDGGSI